MASKNPHEGHDLGPTAHLRDIEPMTEEGEQYALHCLKWLCLICKLPAKSQLHLEADEQAGSYFVLRDYDNTLWVRCHSCKSRFHLNCVAPLADVNEIKDGQFLCSIFHCNEYTSMHVQIAHFHFIFHIVLFLNSM